VRAATPHTPFNNPRTKIVSLSFLRTALSVLCSPLHSRPGWHPTCPAQCGQLKTSRLCPADLAHVSRSRPLHPAIPFALDGHVGPLFVAASSDFSLTSALLLRLPANLPPFRSPLWAVIPLRPLPTALARAQAGTESAATESVPATASVTRPRWQRRKAWMEARGRLGGQIRKYWAWLRLMLFAFLCGLSAPNARVHVSPQSHRLARRLLVQILKYVNLWPLCKQCASFKV
jgi:hypothetical protein